MPTITSPHRQNHQGQIKLCSLLVPQCLWYMGVPGHTSGKELTYQCRDARDWRLICGLGWGPQMGIKETQRDYEPPQPHTAPRWNVTSCAVRLQGALPGKLVEGKLVM